jgi:tetratricopeptide (TPR) repeat protein
MRCAKLHVGILVPAAAVFQLAAPGQETVSHSEPGWATNYANALTAYSTGHYDQVRQALESALEFDDLPANKPQILDAAAALASSYEKLGLKVFAESWYAAILPTIDENSDEERKTLSVVLNNFGSMRVEQGRLREGIPMLEKALALNRHIFGDDSPVTAASLDVIGSAYLVEDRQREAAEVLRQAIGILRKAPPQYAIVLVAAMGHLGRAYTQSEDYAHGNPLFEEALDVGTRIGDTEPTFGDTLISFASSLRIQHKMNRVEPLLRKAQAIYEKTGGMQEMRGAGLLTNFGFLRMDEGKYFAAEEYFRQALGILIKIFGPDTLSVALTEVNLADAVLRVGDYRECGELLDHSYAIERKEFTTTTAFARWSYTRAQLDERLGLETAADGHYKDAIALFEQTAGAHHPLTGDALLTYSRFLANTSR